MRGGSPGTLIRNLSYVTPCVLAVNSSPYFFVRTTKEKNGPPRAPPADKEGVSAPTCVSLVAPETGHSGNHYDEARPVVY